MGMGTEILVERGDQLERMLTAVDESRQGGRLVVLAGEAGHGKTTLIRAFRDRLDHRFSVLTAASDPVSVPTPFAPLYDIVDAFPTDFVGALREGERRPDVYAGVLNLLEASPTVLIIEDLHWADEATMGLVRHIGRRLDRTRSLLVLSYRPEEVDTSHPLLVVLADLSSYATQVAVPPLSVDGVIELAQGHDVDAGQIHQATGGNPFFVEEILANPGLQLPPTIEAAVMAGVAGLPTGSLDMLEMVALSPDGLDLELAARQSPEFARNVDAAFHKRLLIEERGRLRCRHDLIRLTVDRSIPPARRRRIHKRLLAELETTPTTRPDLARLAHHAVHAAEASKAIDYSLAAASFAQSEGANRQARLHYKAALGFRDHMDLATLDRALKEAAEVSCATNHLEEATFTARERLALATDEHDLADRLAWSAFIASRWGNVELARDDATKSLDLHEGHEQCPAVARCWAVLGILSVWSANWDDAADFAAKTVELARQAKSDELLATGLLALGRSMALLGKSDWEEPIQEAIRLGVELGRLETACSGLNSLASLRLWGLDLGEASERFDSGIEFAASMEMDAWYVAMAATKAGVDLSTGNWKAAEEILERAIAWPTCASTDCEAKILLATLHCRRGVVGAGDEVVAALLETDRSGTNMERNMAAALALEAAWLGVFDLTDAVRRYEEMRTVAREASDQNSLFRLDFWPGVLGLRPRHGDEMLEMPWTEWRERGFEYEALVLRAFDHIDDLGEVFDWLRERGANGVVRALRRDLRAEGVQTPAEPRAETAANFAGLTSRQMEVLKLVAEGQTNADIAEQLYISEKTVGHHVSAILDKLSVDNRVQAAALATRRGIVGPVLQR